MHDLTPHHLDPQLPRFQLNEGLRNNISGLYPNGSEWLLRFDDLIAEIEQRWSIQCSGMHRSSMAVVLNADRDGEPFGVLKLMPTEADFFTNELAAHQAFAGSTPALLEVDRAMGAVLFERLHPGESLSALAQTDDLAANNVLASLMKSLMRPAPTNSPFPKVAEWLRDFDQYIKRFGSDGPIETRLVNVAREVFVELVETQSVQVLMHGDLHHANVLSCGGDWRAIDPLGVIGEAEFETAAIMRNPFQPLETSNDLVGLARRRSQQFSDLLDLDRDRIFRWSFAQTVLCLCWQALDDRPLLKPWVRYASFLVSELD